MTDSKFKIKSINKKDKEWIKKFITENWGSEKIVVHGKIFYPQNLPGFIAFYNNKRVGLITYNLENDLVEIISLNSSYQNKGIGTALLKAVEQIAKKNKCKKIWLVTTNDNLDALRFYQKRGFKMITVYPNALEESRKLKPEIPFIGKYGIPLRDEIKLEKDLLL